MDSSLQPLVSCLCGLLNGRELRTDTVPVGDGFYVLVQLHIADDVILEKAMLQLQCLLGCTTADPAEISGAQ